MIFIVLKQDNDDFIAMFWQKFLFMTILYININYLFRHLLMSTSDEIDHAIDAHAAWKTKLCHAIETGECESTPEKVKMDTNCAFGKWLHERIDEGAKSSPFYAKAVDLHANFHKNAGYILELALGDQKEEAKELMGLSSDFTKYSGELTRTLKEWQATL